MPVENWGTRGNNLSDIHPMEPGILHSVDILHTWHIILLSVPCRKMQQSDWSIAIL